MTLTVGSLFSGIGGIDLGLERAGMTVKWHSEIDPFACRVLAKHWPDVPNIGNIMNVKWEDIPYVDVIAGGYPCQPFSLAGKRRGENDPRHLWPYFRDAISIIRPRYALLENVRGHLSMGGLSVIGDLAAIGYDAEWRIISAASVGANHRRDRLVVVAYPNSKNESDVARPTKERFGMVADSDNPKRRTSRNDNHLRGRNATASEQDGGQRLQHRTSGRGSVMADSDCGYSTDGGERPSVPCEDRSGRNDRGGSGGDPREVGLGGAGEDSRSVPDSDVRKTCRRDGRDEPDRGAVFGRENLRRGTSGYAGWEWWQAEPEVGRVANGVPSRVDRLRGLGNAVVPQVAEIVGRLIMEHACD